MRKKHLIIFTSLLFILSQDIGVQAQQYDAPAVKLTSVALHQLSGGVVFIRAKVNDYPDSLNFILDTGSGGISLDSSTCVEFNIPIMPSEKTIRGIGGIRKVKFLNDASLHLPGLTVDSLDFHVNDYEILTAVYGIKVDGIIGYSLLSRYIVRLDYDVLQLEIFTPGAYRYPPNGHLLLPLLTNIPILSTTFTDRRPFDARFYFDTGAGLSLLLSEEFVRDSAVLMKRKKPPVITQAEGLGGKMTMRLTVVKDVRIGPYRFRKVPVFLFDDVYKVTSYPFLGGLIGNDLLRRFNVVLNYQKREIHLTPNRSIDDPFDYSYTGLGMYFTKNRVVIEDVLEGSPGQKAGFRAGDVILAINHNFSNDIQVYKAMLQNHGERLRFFVIRDEKVLELFLKPARIY